MKRASLVRLRRPPALLWDRADPSGCFHPRRPIAHCCDGCPRRAAQGSAG